MGVEHHFFLFSRLYFFLFQPDGVITLERAKVYGSSVALCEVKAALSKIIPDGASVKEVRKVTASLLDGLGHGSVDSDLLRLCIDNNRVEIAKHLFKCGARWDIMIKVSEHSGKDILLELFSNYTVNKNRIYHGKYLVHHLFTKINETKY